MIINCQILIKELTWIKQKMYLLKWIKWTIKKVTLLLTIDYNFFLGRIFFASNGRTQNTFVYQPAVDALELKKIKLLIMFSVGSQMECIILNSNHYILLSCIV